MYICINNYIWWFPEIGVTPVIIHFNGIFPNKNHPATGVPPFMETPIDQASRPCSGQTLEYLKAPWRCCTEKNGMSRNINGRLCSSRNNDIHRYHRYNRMIIDGKNGYSWIPAIRHGILKSPIDGEVYSGKIIDNCGIVHCHV